MTDVDPNFPRYLIPQTMIDGPRKTDGEIEFRLLCRAVVVPPDEKLAAGEPIQLQVFDFAGPKVEHDPGPIPPELLDACAAALLEAEVAADGLLPVRDRAQVVLEEIGRRLRPSDSDAVSLALGVRDLDVEKLTKTGDEMAAILRAVDPDGWATLLATWKGQAHRDWSDLHALRRST